MDHEGVEPDVTGHVGGADGGGDHGDGTEGSRLLCLALMQGEIPMINTHIPMRYPVMAGT
jgi:hypothetical protein